MEKKLLLVSGKGGVGKTTISVSLGLALSHLGRRVLIAEIQSQDQVARIFGREPIGHQETLVAPNLWAINIDPKKSFREYVLSQIKSTTLYSAVFENKFTRYFLDATPGLSELMSIGKIYSMAKDYDHVIVDAPATGHGISLLQIPSIVTSAVRIGPLKEQAGRVEDFLKDADRTSLVIVTLSEELPVNEAIYMKKWVDEKLHVPIGPIIINGVFRPLPRWSRAKKNTELEPAYRCAEDYGKRVRLARYYVEKLNESIPDGKFIEVPYYYSDGFGLHEVKMISELLAEEMITS